MKLELMITAYSCDYGHILHGAPKLEHATIVRELYPLFYCIPGMDVNDFPIPVLRLPVNFLSLFPMHSSNAKLIRTEL